MDHDGLSFNIGSSTSATGEMASTLPARYASNGPSAGPTLLAGTGTNTGRILCPVDGCPEASVTSRKHFHKFADIKNHLNAHCTGYLSGAVPVDFLRCHRYTQCSVCDKIIHTRYNGTCPRCRPMAQAQEQMNEIRGEVLWGIFSDNNSVQTIS